MIDSVYGTPDPFGWDLAVWCTLSGCLLLALIVGGFVVLWLTAQREERLEGDRPLIGTAADLSLLDLWRLSRSLGSASEEAVDPPRAAEKRAVVVRSAR